MDGSLDSIELIGRCFEKVSVPFISFIGESWWGITLITQQTVSTPSVSCSHVVHGIDVRAVAFFSFLISGVVTGR